jgi:hypothetical protein
MSYKFLGTYKGYDVYKHPYTAHAREYPSDGNIYLVHSGDGYRMVLNGVPCGYCDSQYCVEEFEEPQIEEFNSSYCVKEFEEPQIEEFNFTSSSWTTDPNPQVVEEEPKEETKPEPQPAATSSSDFWTRVQEDINSVLKSTAI